MSKQALKDKTPLHFYPQTLCTYPPLPANSFEVSGIPVYYLAPLLILTKPFLNMTNQYELTAYNIEPQLVFMATARRMQIGFSLVMQVSKDFLITERDVGDGT
jgi:hypothetical protein